jgi:hypothetical protein
LINAGQLAILLGSEAAEPGNYFAIETIADYSDAWLYRLKPR